MKTAIEMYQFCRERKYGQGQNEKWALKHFGLIQNSLAPDEDVVFCFIGLHNYVSATKHDNNFAYAITKKRIIMAQKRLVGEAFQTVFIDNVNDITFQSGMVFGTITIDTIKEKFNIALDKTQAANINSEIHSILHSLKQNDRPETTLPMQQSGADEILKYKQLMDQGIITHDEYEAKKRQLLGI